VLPALPARTALCATSAPRTTERDPGHKFAGPIASSGSRSPRSGPAGSTGVPLEPWARQHFGAARHGSRHARAVADAQRTVSSNAAGQDRTASPLPEERREAGRELHALDTWARDRPRRRGRQSRVVSRSAAQRDAGRHGHGRHAATLAPWDRITQRRPDGLASLATLHVSRRRAMLEEVLSPMALRQRSGRRSCSKR